MSKTTDIGSKRLIGLRPTTWIRWLTDTPDIEVQEILSGDFQWVSRANDVLIKAVSPELGTFLVVNEIQIRPDKHIDRRIRAYTALAEERYALKTYSVVVNILPPRYPNETIVTGYHSEFLGQTSHHDFKVINLWEQDVNLVFEKNVVTLLPFVPILKGGDNEATITKAVTLLQADEKLVEMEPLLAFFASFVLKTNIVQKIMRWDMTILRESPWYNELIQEGIEQGIQEGIEQGIQEGQKELLLRFLTIRFKNVPTKAVENIDKLRADQLLKLTDFAFTAPSLAAVEKLLLGFVAESNLEDNEL